jgi:inner membrane protein
MKMNVSKLKSSVMVRMFVTASLGLFLLLLAQRVGSLISEREHRRDEAIREVSEKWGGTQTVTGPILTLPFKKPVKNEKGGTVLCIDYLHIMPDKLQAEVDVNPEVRYRGIYEVILYQSLVRLKGIFVLPKLEKQGVSPENLILKEAFVTVGITDLRGIKNAITLDWEGAKLPASPGIKSPNVVKSGFTVFPAVDLSKNEYLFSADLHLNGCGEFNIIPVGKETRVTLSSKWRSPSFTEAIFRKRGRSRRMDSERSGMCSTSAGIFHRLGPGAPVPWEILHSVSDCICPSINTRR